MLDKRQGQIEIFGLVIIVILVSLGLLFALVVLSRPKGKEVARVKESLLASNFLSTMLSTTTDCGGRTMRELLQDCAVTDENWIGAYTCPPPTLENTCQRFISIAKEMLENTFEEWNKDYVFYINGTRAVENPEFFINSPGLGLGEQCPGEREGKTRTEKIRPGLDVYVTLHICQ